MMYVEASLKECQQEHLRAWVADPQGRDQFVTYNGDEITIFWHSKKAQQVDESRKVRSAVIHTLAHANADLG